LFGVHPEISFSVISACAAEDINISAPANDNTARDVRPVQVM
jgi:hypothetical protein